MKLPLVVVTPLQPPEAMHDVASSLDQVRSAVCPGSTVVGLAESVTVGGSGVGLAAPAASV